MQLQLQQLELACCYSDTAPQTADRSCSHAVRNVQRLRGAPWRRSGRSAYRSAHSVGSCRTGPGPGPGRGWSREHRRSGLLTGDVSILCETHNLHQWGTSSNGRANASHALGRGIDAPVLHPFSLEQRIDFWDAGCDRCLKTAVSTLPASSLSDSDYVAEWLRR